MTYAELREFASTMTQLGYPKQISVDSFRAPNFQLMADVMAYLIRSMVTDAKLSESIGTVEDRVYFVTTAVSLAQTHFCVKISPKRLYAADISCVHELLKIASQSAQFLYISPPERQQTAFADLSQVANSLRNQASELIRRSTDLLLALKQSGDAAPANLQAALNKQPDVRQLQQAVQNRIGLLEEEIVRFGDELQTNKREKLHFQELLTQKQADLSRMNDRVESMRTTRPPYLIELEKTESELSKIHQEYAKKHRSLSYLESQLRTGEQQQKARNKQKQANMDAIRAVVQQEEEENIVKGGMAATDDVMNQLNTPNPMKTNIPISGGGIDGESYEEVYEDENENEDDEIDVNQHVPQGKQQMTVQSKAQVQAQKIPQQPPKRDINFSENESVPEDDGSDEDINVPVVEEPKRPVPGRPQATVQKPVEPPKKPINNDSDEVVAPPQRGREPEKPKPNMMQYEPEEEEYEYVEEEVDDDGQ